MKNQYIKKSKIIEIIELERKFINNMAFTAPKIVSKTLNICLDRLLQEIDKMEIKNV